MNKYIYQILKDALWKFTFLSVYAILFILLVIKFIAYVNG
jgi:hypothetical protein